MSGKVLVFLKFAVVSARSLLSEAFRRALCVLQQAFAMDVDSKPTMEETILVGDDLMMGPPLTTPPEIASHVLEGVDTCDGILRNLFLCLQINDIEPFCQDEIAIYRQCAERRTLDLASGVEGMEGFRQRWSLHGRLTDTKRRLDALKQGMENRKKR
ncbi:UNVERIFIED_CONTAM: hypothetical protein Sangu_0273500 [Sesamum angustifolium]|uniref:DUF7803 domain-containing protein n=1 Tax=Sesamum angustifolium TaxID=2727405 RepID=A0AAW2QP05_9LAMI